MVNQPGAVATHTGRPAVYDIIGRRLRNYYDEVATQPVPPRFLELLEELDSKIASKKEQ